MLACPNSLNRLFYPFGYRWFSSNGNSSLSQAITMGSGYGLRLISNVMHHNSFSVRLFLRSVDFLPEPLVSNPFLPFYFDKKIKVFLCHGANPPLYLACTFTRKYMSIRHPVVYFCLIVRSKDINFATFWLERNCLVTFYSRKKRWSTSHIASGKLRCVATGSSSDGFSISVFCQPPPNGCCIL